MISTVYDKLIHIAQQRFPEIVVGGKIFYSTTGRARKLRIYLFNDSFVDIWISVDGKRYSYQWIIPDRPEFVYRHDNAPHASWESVSSFSKHCHFRRGDALKFLNNFLPIYARGLSAVSLEGPG